MRLLSAMIAACGLLAVPNAAIAQSDEWFVGFHPDYHAAMVRDLDGIFVAVYVAKEPSIYASPLLMETLAPACDTAQPVEMHGTQAILAFGRLPRSDWQRYGTLFRDFSTEVLSHARSRMISRLGSFIGSTTRILQQMHCSWRRGFSRSRKALSSGLIDAASHPNSGLPSYWSTPLTLPHWRAAV